ncbi:MAG: SHOCT domain-containing protein [Mycobacterium sp.]
MAVAGVGFIVTLLLNAFVLDKYNAYGEVPIPGSGSLHLPAGEVTVSFHTRVIGSPTGGGLPVPPLGMSVDPPAGVAEPVVTESFGSTTTVNNDAHVRVWVVQVPTDGVYSIKTEGQVGGFISPRLAFGPKSPYGWVVWVFVVLFVVGLLDLICGLWWAVRIRRRPRRVATEQRVPVPEAPDVLYTPSDRGVRVEQLKTLAALRDSGALTEAEFEAEKRRILDGR